MLTREVANANAVLASGDVSLVLVQGILRRESSRANTSTSKSACRRRAKPPAFGAATAGNRLAESLSMVEGRMLDRRHVGNLLAFAKGPVMVDPWPTLRKTARCCAAGILGAAWS